MKQIFLTLVLCAFANIAPARAADAPATSAPATQAAATQPSTPQLAADGTRYASAELSFEPPFPLNDDLILGMVQRRATELATAIGLGAANRNEWLRISPVLDRREQLKNLTITVNLTGTRAPAAALPLLDALIETAIDQSRGEQFDAVVRRKLEPLERRVSELEAMRQVSRARDEKLRARMRELSGRAEVSPQGISAAVSKLEEERQRLELDMLGKTARREALERHIAEQTERAQQQASSDAIVAELQKVVETREAQINRIKQMAKDAFAGESEVQEAVSRAAEARAKLLERRHDAAAEAGGEMLQPLNREMVTLSIDLREIAARLEYTQSRLPPLREALDLSGDVARVQAEVRQAEDELKSAERMLRLVRSEIGSPPAISVIDRVWQREAPPSPGLFGDPPQRDAK